MRSQRWIGLATTVLVICMGTNVFGHDGGTPTLRQAEQIALSDTGGPTPSGEGADLTAGGGPGASVAVSGPLTRGPAAEPQKAADITPPFLGGLLAIGIVCALVGF